MGLEPEGEAATRARNKEQAQHEEALNADIAATFGSAAGKRVWEFLWKQTIMQPTFMGHLGMDKAVPVGFAREGQNALIMDLYRRMRKGTDVE